MYAIIATFDRVFTNKITELQNKLTNVIGTNQLAGVEPHITIADYNELDVNLYIEKLKEFVAIQETCLQSLFLLLELFLLTVRFF